MSVRPALRPLRANEPLLAGSPGEVLARLLDGDPLGLGARVTARLRERALLCDAERVLVRALALCAEEASMWPGTPCMEAWLRERIDEAIEQAIDEDQGPWNETLPARSSPWSVFASPLGLDAAALREGCARFNRLAPELREAFFLVVVDARAGDELCRARGISLSELGRRARQALDALRAPLPAGLGAGP
jgi:DNA-directed RNA polymerase specialized sigma24 family protein